MKKAALSYWSKKQGGVRDQKPFKKDCYGMGCKPISVWFLFMLHKVLSYISMFHNKNEYYGSIITNFKKKL